jgi:hypothetical protein
MAEIAVLLILEIAGVASPMHFSEAPLAAIARGSTAMDNAGTGSAFFASFLICVGLIGGTRLF